MMQSRYRRCAAALVLLCASASSACLASEPEGHERHEKLVLPFHYSPDAPDPMAAFRKLSGELRQRARAEARDRDYEPVVQWDQLGDGRWLLVSAVTPRRGVFYWMLAGPYGVYGRNTILKAQENIPVCRFTFIWDRFPDGPVIPNLSWSALPTPECNAPLPSEIERIAAWRRARSEATYTVLGEVGAGSVRTWLVAQSGPAYPFDSSAAAALVAGDGDGIVRATPVGSYYHPSAFVTTRNGRFLVGFHDGSSGSLNAPGCIAEGLEWNDLVANGPASAAMTRARRLCAQLVRRQNEKDRLRSERDLETDPIIVQPIK